MASAERDDRFDPFEAARELARRLFGTPRAAWLGGSVLTHRRTPTSDLDIVVVTGARDHPYRQSFSWQGWPVELFVHDEDSLRAYCAHDIRRWQPSLPRMIAEGEIVVEGDGLAARVQAEMKDRLAAGPPPLRPGELDRRRYGLTDLLDDLAGAADPDERAVVCWHVLVDTAQLALLAAGHWLGSGKWLVRELRDHDPELADRLLAARDDPERLGPVAIEVLNRVGGPLWDGYHTAGARNPAENRLTSP